jgi:uncharacterized LabA/DUF88 family protein
MKDRVVIFIDYQNVFKVANNYFLGQNSPAKFEIAMHKIALKVIEYKKHVRELKQIRIYTGIPSKFKQPKSHALASKRIESWKLDPLVKVITRPVSYPVGWPKFHKPGENPREKGIDVKLAIDFVTMAIRGEYDIGILFSVDTDLKPALEFVLSDDVSARAEVAAWRRKASNQIRLALSGNRPFCHWLTEDDFYKSLYETNYFVNH